MKEPTWAMLILWDILFWIQPEKRGTMMSVKFSSGMVSDQAVVHN